MNYRPLKKLQYQLTVAELNQEYQKRREGYGTFQLSLTITPIRKGNLVPTQAYDLFLVHIPELYQLQEAIQRTSQQIQAIANQLPQLAKTQHFNHLLINELQSTNEIEHVRSTKKELTAVLNADNSLKKQRFVGLVHMYQSLATNQFTQLEHVNDFREIYDQLVAAEVNADDQLDGLLFRKEGVSVMGSTRTIHRGMTPEQKIMTSLSALIAFMKQDAIPMLYRIMVMHYYFEYIHPFYDGNGRVGRYLVVHYLARYLDPFTAMSLAYTINQEKTTYYQLFEEASDPQNYGEITFFCWQMLQFLQKGQQQVLADLETKQQRMHVIEQNLAHAEREAHLTAEQREVITIFANFRLFAPNDSFFTQIQLAEAVNMSRQKLDRISRELAAKGYLVKKQQKPIVYMIADAYLAQLLKPTVSAQTMV